MRSVSHPGTHLNITLNDIDSTKSQIIFEYLSKFFMIVFRPYVIKRNLSFVLNKFKYLYIVYQSIVVFVLKRSIYFFNTIEQIFPIKIVPV